MLPTTCGNRCTITCSCWAISDSRGRACSFLVPLLQIQSESSLRSSLHCLCYIIPVKLVVNAGQDDSTSVCNKTTLLKLSKTVLWNLNQSKPPHVTRPVWILSNPTWGKVGRPKYERLHQFMSMKSCSISLFLHTSTSLKLLQDTYITDKDRNDVGKLTAYQNHKRHPKYGPPFEETTPTAMQWRAETFKTDAVRNKEVDFRFRPKWEAASWAERHRRD